MASSIYMRFSLPILVLLVGCQSSPRLAGLNPFYTPERTSIERPYERMEAIRALADRSTGQDTPDQRSLVEGLIKGLQSENDPMLREASFETIAAFNVPLARETVATGIQDTDPYVRSTCCKLLGAYGDEASVGVLARTLREDADIDVRVAAARGLGNAPAGRELLVAALQDNDPALQYVGVQAMKELTGQDYGGNVAAYVALARGETPQATPEQPVVNVASQAADWLPFF